MTHWGTNTYILGDGKVAVIDPGPDHPAHLQAILDALRGETVSHILVTHAHKDHTGLAPSLSRATGAPILAFGPATAGRNPAMEALSRQGIIGGGEGVDYDFVPDQTLSDGEVVTGDGWQVTALWTPGHFAGHMCFEWQGRIFTGDLVMGWASTLISPPDGDVSAFMNSCAMLKRRGAVRFYPGHGAPIIDTDARVSWLIRHRRERESQILAALGTVPVGLKPLTRRIYHDAPERLLPAAERNVLAHLVDLEARALIRATPTLSTRATFSRL